MFKLSIFKQSIKDSYKLWVVLTTVSCLFITIVIIMAKNAPEMNLPGAQGGSLLEIMGGAFYGIMGFTLFLAYVIITGNKLVASEIDNGDMSFTLNTPITRKQLIYSKALYYVTSISVLILLLTIVGFVSSALIMPGELDFGGFLLLNLGLALFLFAISGLSFFASCWFDKTNKSLMIGGGVPIAFFLISTISSFGNDFEVFKYFTLNSLFDVNAIIEGEGYVLQFIILVIIGLILYTIGIKKFLTKDLPL